MSTATAPREAYQYPQPFPLDDEVTSPAGDFSGARARVYSLLRITMDTHHCHPVGVRLGPPGWTPAFLLCEPWSGGSEGKKRARELRNYGCELEISRFEVGDSATTLYRLKIDGIRAGHPAAAPAPSPQPQASPQPQPGPRRTVLARVDVLLVHSFAQTAGKGREVIELAPFYPVGIGPSRALLVAAEDGRKEPAQLDEEYLAELRRHHQVGHLLDSADRWKGRRMAIVCGKFGRFDWSPVAALRRALEALGATVTVEE